MAAVRDQLELRDPKAYWFSKPVLRRLKIHKEFVGLAKTQIDHFKRKPLRDLAGISVSLFRVILCTNNLFRACYI